VRPGKVKVNGLLTPVTRAKCSNNGHGYDCTFTFTGPTPTITGGPLANEYEFVQCHFHWPSEHVIDGVGTAAEFHLVHFNKKKYGTFAAAAAQPDGLAVLGVSI
jgi:carbonic anhydrase